MRHGIAGNKLNRNSSHRKATVRDIAKAALVQQRICTTKAKAKEARKLVDKLITLGKKGALADKRRAFSILCDHQLVSDLFSKTSPRFTNRVGGYTRIIPLGTRRGDNAQLVYLELTEKQEVIVSKPKSTATAKEVNLDSASTKTKGIEAEEKAKIKERSKEQLPKKDIIKEQTKTAVAKQEKSKVSKKIVGGLRKIFNKKSSGK